MLLFSFFILLPLVVADDQKDVVQETLKQMLGFNRVPAESVEPQRVTSKQVSKQMDIVYKTFVDEDGSDDGNVVRAIEPSVGKVENQEVLIFDVSGFNDETIMRAELHFLLRKKLMSRRRTKAFSARVLCTNEYCTEAEYLHQIPTKENEVVWDATKSMVEIHALGGKQLIVRLSRKDVKMRTYSEMVRRSVPYLLLFSRGDNSLDSEKVQEEVQGTRRRRRENRENSFYSLQEDQTSTPSEKSRKEMENHLEAAKIRNTIRKELKYRVRGTRRPKNKDDIWHGFGEDEDEEEEEENNDFELEEEHESNDIKVVLLDDKKNTCQRHSMVVDFVELGWDKFILAPAFFEAGRCAGTCEYPLKKKQNPSNHAVLQSLLVPKAPVVCCSPERMSSLTVMFRDVIGRVVIKNFPDMLVQSCACN